MSNFYRFYGDAPRTLKAGNESADDWIKRERQQKAWIGQTLSLAEDRLMRELALDETEENPYGK